MLKRMMQGLLKRGDVMFQRRKEQQHEPTVLEPLESRLLLSGTSFVVNSLGDGPIDGADEFLTLREAIMAANTNAAIGDIPAGSAVDVDIITFDQTKLEAEANGGPLVISLNGTQLSISDSVDIQGLGRDVLAIDANQLSRVLHIVDVNTNFQLAGMTITGGMTSLDGGGIYNLDATVTVNDSIISENSAVDDGGGVANYGIMTLNNSTVSGNSSTDDAGGIINHGTMTLDNSIVSANASGLAGSASSASHDGGGIYNSSGSITLNNSTVTGNSATDDGGGITNFDTITLTNSTVSGNTANDNGGGIYNWKGGTVTLTDSIVSGNITTDYGGGIWNYTNGVVDLTNTTVSLNTAVGGAGIYNYRGTVSLANSTVSSNSVTSNINNGGGIYNDSSATLTLTRSTIFGNSTGNQGGGIYNANSSTLTMSNSTISGNSSGSAAGGVQNVSSSTLTMINSTISANSAGAYGGGIGNSGTITLIDSAITENSSGQGGGGIQTSGTGTLVNTTISGNSAAQGGGGLYNLGTLELTNTIVSSNSANFEGGGIRNGSGTLTLTNSTLADNSSGRRGGGIDNGSTLTLNNTIVTLNQATNSDNDIAGVYTNNSSLISTDPLFVRNPNNGGDGWIDDPVTLAIDESANNDYGDLRLQPASLAINTGDNTLLPADTFDLDGDNDTAETLPLDLASKARINDNIVDIGAYEYVPPSRGDFNYDNAVDVLDADQLSVALNMESTSAIYDVNDDGEVNSADGLYLVETLLGTIRADFNIDYQVDVSDLSIWASGFGKTSALFSQGDANFDGQVDVSDLSEWATGFGNTVTQPGSSTENPIPIFVNSSNHGAIEAEGEDVWYRFEAEATYEYTFETLLTGLEDSALTLYDQDGSTILESDDNGGGGLASRIDWTASVSGTYYLKVGSVSGIVGGYQLEFTTPPVQDIDVELPFDSDDVHALNFGGLIEGKSASWTFTVHNEGERVLTVSEVSGLAAPFNMTPTNGGDGADDWVIQPDGTQEFTIEFAPTTVDSFSSTLILTSDDPDEAAYEIEISGIGLPSGEIDVELPGTPDDVHTFDFGAIDVAENVSSTFTIHNEGVGVLTVFGASDLDSPFSVTPINDINAGADWILQPGATQEITIHFDPTAVGQFSDTLILISDDIDEASYSIDVAGVAFPTPPTHYVVNSRANTIADDGVVTLREALEAANSNTAVTGDVQAGSAYFADVITFDQEALSIEAGVAVGELLSIWTGGTELEITDDLTIQGLGDAILHITAVEFNRVFSITAGTEVELSGLTITGGRDTHGGGILNSGTLTLTNSTVVDNWADLHGSGIYNDLGVLTLIDSTVSDNLSYEVLSGGGIYNVGGLATLIDSIVSNNRSKAGGGIFNNNGTFILTNSIVSGNFTSGGLASDGGGIHNNSGSLTLTNSIVTDNVGTLGGGIYSNGADSRVTLIDSTVSNNQADYGGGLYANNSAVIEIANSSIDGNLAELSGGGIYNRLGNLTLTNTIVSSNGVSTTNEGGGGIYSIGSATLMNSTVAGNWVTGSASTGGGIFNHFNSTLTLDNSIVALNDAPADSDISGPVFTNTSLVGGDPGFVRNPSAGTDGVWGTADDDAGDLQLMANGAAVDTGSNTLLPVDSYDLDADGDFAELLPIDLIGNARISGGTVDMGAYEYTPAPPAISLLQNPSTFDTASVNSLSLTEANRWDHIVSLVKLDTSVEKKG